MPPGLGHLAVSRLIVEFLHPRRDARQMTYTVRKPIKLSIEWYMSHLGAVIMAGAVVEKVEKDRVTL